MIKTTPRLIPRLNGFSIEAHLEYGYLTTEAVWQEKIQSDFLECVVTCTGEVQHYPEVDQWHICIFQAKEAILPASRLSEDGHLYIIFLQPSEELLDIKMQQYGASPHGYGAWVIVRTACCSCGEVKIHRFFLTKYRFLDIPLHQ